MTIIHEAGGNNLQQSCVHATKRHSDELMATGVVRTRLAPGASMRILTRNALLRVDLMGKYACGSSASVAGSL